MDRIFIEGLAARCIIGLGPEERRENQDVLIDLVLGADLRQAARSDRFEDAVDYRVIKKQVLALTEGSQFQLLEALAQAIADACLATPRVQEAEVTVHKPGALRFARSVAVRLVRSR